MDKAEYVGPLVELRGKKALIRYDDEDEYYLFAQFDDMNLLHPKTNAHLGYHWHKFLARDFKILVRIRV